MFISNKSKQNIQNNIQDLYIQVENNRINHEQEINALKEENLSLSKRLNQLVVSGIAFKAREKSLKKMPDAPTRTDHALARDAYRKEYSKQYYWRKKAERIANGSHETIRKTRKHKTKDEIIAHIENVSQQEMQ